LSDSEWWLLSLAEIAYSGWSLASLTLLRKVEEEPQLLVVFVVTAANVAALEEEHMACLDQQHSRKEGQAVVVVVEDLSISDLDDSSNLDCICCLKGHNYSAVVGFATEGVYYECLQHKLQVAH